MIWNKSTLLWCDDMKLNYFGPHAKARNLGNVNSFTLSSTNQTCKRKLASGSLISGNQSAVWVLTIEEEILKIFRSYVKWKKESKSVYNRYSSLFLLIKVAFINSSVLASVEWVEKFWFLMWSSLFGFISRVEKYRPNSLEDLISHKDIITTSKLT